MENPFETLPNEVLYEMCENWDTGTLVNMSEAYKRVNEVCSKIIDLRKKETLEINELKRCLKEVINYFEESGEISEAPLFAMENSPNQKLSSMVMKLYPSLYQLHEEINEKYGEDIWEDEYPEEEWNEELYVEKYNESRSDMLKTVIDLLEDKQSLYDFALITDQWLQFKDIDFHDFLNCVPEEVAKQFKPVRIKDELWFSEEQKEYHEMTKEQRFEYDLRQIIDELYDKGYTKEQIFQMMIELIPGGKEYAIRKLSE